MKHRILIFLGLTLITLAPKAQTPVNNWSLGLFLGKNEYAGDLGDAMLKPQKAYYAIGAMQLNYYLSKSFDAGVTMSYGDYGFFANPEQRFIGHKFDFSFLMTRKLNDDLAFPSSWDLSPSVVFGLGGALYGGKYIETKGLDVIVPLGLNFKYTISPKVAVQYSCVYNFTFNDGRDMVINNVNDKFMKHTLGIVISYGAACDGDHDGVKDKFDRCLNSPYGVPVNEVGCPADSDGDGVTDDIDSCVDKRGTPQMNGCPDSDKDGIADKDDKCPFAAGIAQFDGCPDTDNDGIPDGRDDCPQLAGSEKFAGCPDTDNDGIKDSEDKCPDAAGPASFSGCPDTDRDGIPDNEDRCPDAAGDAKFKGCPDHDNDGVPDIDDKCFNEAGPLIFNGCPDHDNDSIPDSEDKCPYEAGIAANKGCPEVKEDVLKIFQQALTGIQFQTGKDIILPSSYPILNNIVRIMLDNPEYNLEINGHTDNVGDENDNMVLSQKRANSVKAYLVSKGVAQERLVATGYGENVQIGDNNTPEGRAMNRRVEFKVVF